AKNVLRRTIQCNKSGSPIHSTIPPLVNSILFCFGLQHLQVSYFGRYGNASRNRLATHRLLLFITDWIFFFRARHTGTLGETMTIRRLAQWIRGSSGFLFFVLSAAFKTQVQQFEIDVSNSATQDSIMNAHKKTQLTHAKINCALKDSSYDLPLSKNLKLTILASNESSSSTKVIKCPHTKNDSIFTHNGSQFSSSEIKCNTHTRKDEHNA
ncbi:hypothetical protein H5410_030889, partial [Solanum commersonii]